MINLTSLSSELLHDMLNRVLRQRIGKYETRIVRVYLKVVEKSDANVFAMCTQYKKAIIKFGSIFIRRSRTLTYLHQHIKFLYKSCNVPGINSKNKSRSRTQNTQQHPFNFGRIFLKRKMIQIRDLQIS